MLFHRLIYYIKVVSEATGISFLVITHEFWEIQVSGFIVSWIFVETREICRGSYRSDRWLLIITIMGLYVTLTELRSVEQVHKVISWTRCHLLGLWTVRHFVYLAPLYVSGTLIQYDRLIIVWDNNNNWAEILNGILK